MNIPKREIKSVVLAAGKIIKDNFYRDKKISTKSTSSDLVTLTDTKVENYLKKEFKAIIPDSKFISEETDSNYKDYKNVWIIDPIDGTTNFVHRFPFVCISVALQQDNNLVYAIVHNPILDETYTAEKNQGSYLNGEKITVSETDKLEECLFATGFPYNFTTCEENNIRYFEYYHKIVHGVRRPGSAALDLCYLAKGVYDGFWEFGLHIWDVAAGILIIREAGGVVTNLAGAEFDPKNPKILATNGIIHDKMLINMRNIKKNK